MQTALKEPFGDNMDFSTMIGEVTAQVAASASSATLLYDDWYSALPASAIGGKRAAKTGAAGHSTGAGTNRCRKILRRARSAEVRPPTPFPAASARFRGSRG